MIFHQPPENTGTSRPNASSISDIKSTAIQTDRSLFDDGSIPFTNIVTNALYPRSPNLLWGRPGMSSAILFFAHA